ncbi:neurogenic differentiation factor 1-like [Papaver somniferum]|uniref:neurogenic differentiation factor 1-like n=1 Tax=Papaver somniferum TaxID=3469 RepID=UPI000E6FA89F|nr:neurogenic differentiation factor 1-like [Papaver somniferum]
MLRNRNTTYVQIGRIYEPSIEGPISGVEEDLAVQTRAMREAEKEKEDERVEEPDNEADESDKDQSMSDENNEDEAEDDWRIPIHQYLDKGTLPTDIKEARKLESKAAMYSLRNGILYRRSFLGPLMQCLSQT